MIFKDRNFVTFWVGSFVSGLGDAMFLLALSWMVVRATGSSETLGLLMATMSLPQILFSLMGGVLIDRLDPKHFMMASDAVRLAAMLFLVAVSSSQGMPPIWSLFVVALVFGTMDAGFWPAAAKLKQYLVVPDQYVQSNGSLMVASQTTQIIGPALAGMLAASGHFDVIIALNAATYGVSIACLTFVTATEKADAPVPAHTASVLSGMTQGIRYVLQTPLLVVTSLAAFVVNACLATVMVAIPLLAHQLHVGSQGFGLMMAALGVGGALGAVVFAVIRLRRPTPRMTLFATGLEGVLFIMLGLAQHLALVVLVLGSVGLVEVAVNTIAPSVNQRIIPARVFGRVISVTIVLMSGSEPMAKAASGWIIAQIGVSPVLWWAGALDIAISTVAFFVPVVRTYSTADQQ